MAISASMVKELRESTGAGMMDCKKALTQANGDLEKAVEILREKGLAAAAKKAGRIAAEGAVVAFVNEDSKIASLVEVNCETDFVAANEEFLGFANKVAEIAAKSNATTVEELSAEKCDGESTIDEVRTALVAKLGENMTVRRFVRFSVENGAIQSYIHAAGKIGVLVQLGCENNSPALLEVAKDVAMHIAAVNPLFLDSSAVDAETLEKEREIYRVQAQNEGKPANIVEKMVEGRVKKYLKEVCLVEQVFVKNPDFTITKYLAEKSKEVGATITIEKFARFERGEGIEKKEENFAEEVQRQMNAGK
ncbi:translation elongation factor Ts [Clostridium bornimense]|uniref:translation elongation factor Ts n=1 Tax=Clostridium bornimense TaxID=1216932 RepID=UPI001C10BB87|nr:translation elongation factor Ts [Clostridium bornimense]MBU5317141.1 translation elongation factor Ts [Clostridium bornimense]